MKPIIVAILFSLLISSALRAEDTPTRATERTVLLISAPGAPMDIDRLRDTLDAHMSDLDATITLRPLEDLPEDRETQVDAARALLQENPDARAAVWLDAHGARLMILIRDRATVQLIERPLDTDTEDDDQRCDAAAAVVRAALTPWFSAEETAESAPAPAPKPTAPPTSDTTTTPDRHPHAGRMRTELLAAYTLDLNLEGHPASGGAVRAGLLLVDRFLLGVNLRLLAPLDMSIPEHHISLFRLPLTLIAAVVFRAGSVVLGVQLGWTFDIARVLGADESAAPEPIQRTRMGFSPSGIIRYLLGRRSSIDLTLGVDIFGEPYHYRWDGAIVLTNGTLHPFGLLGVSFDLPARKEADYP